MRVKYGSGVFRNDGFAMGLVGSTHGNSWATSHNGKYFGQHALNTCIERFEKQAGDVLLLELDGTEVFK